MCLSWLKDESLEDGNELAEPQDLASEAITELEAVVDDLREIVRLIEREEFFLEYQAEPNLQQLVGEIPWGQNLLIMAKVKDLTARAYYLRMTAEQGWSHNVLLNQIW